jgi:RNA recognition motif-containing protein
MAGKLYVGNLNYQTQEEDLRSLFAQFGEIASANIVVDRDTGRSRGFGFVEFTDEEAAKAAESALNGTELDGRALRVNEARPRQPRKDRGGHSF